MGGLLDDSLEFFWQAVKQCVKLCFLLLDVLHDLAPLLCNLMWREHAAAREQHYNHTMSGQQTHTMSWYDTTHETHSEPHTYALVYTTPDHARVH